MIEKMLKIDTAISFLHKRGVMIGRLGLAFVLLYAAIQSLLFPDDWIGFVPSGIEVVISRDTFLRWHAVLELIAGISLVLGRGVLLSTAFAALNMLGIMLAVGVDSVTFRDVGLLSLALMLIGNYVPKDN
jgi:uncharacterized membrane protein YphA (DoxX/SURF4 family)